MIDVFDSLAVCLVDGTADWVPRGAGPGHTRGVQFEFWFACPRCERLTQLDGEKVTCPGCGRALPIVRFENPDKDGLN